MWLVNWIAIDCCKGSHRWSCFLIIHVNHLSTQIACINLHIYIISILYHRTLFQKLIILKVLLLSPKALWIYIWSNREFVRATNHRLVCFNKVFARAICGTLPPLCVLYNVLSWFYRKPLLKIWIHKFVLNNFPWIFMQL